MTGWPDDWMTGSFADNWLYGILFKNVFQAQDYRHFIIAFWWWYILSQHHQIVTICNRRFYPQKLFLVVVAETTWHHSPLKVQNKISNRGFFRKPSRKIPTVVCSNENPSGYILLWGFKLCACCACLQTSCLACEYQLQTCKQCFQIFRMKNTKVLSAWCCNACLQDLYS